MKFSIKSKVIVPLFILAGVISVVGTTGIYMHFQLSLFSQLELRTKSIADAVRRSVEISRDIGNSQRMLHAFGEDEDIKGIVLSAGRPAKVVSATRSKYIGDSIDLIEDAAVAKHQREVIESKMVLVEYDRAGHQYLATVPVLLRPTSDSLAPIVSAVTVQLDASSTLTEVGHSTAIWASSFVVVIMLMAAAIYQLLSHIVITPLSKLETVIASRLAGDTSSRVPITTDDEIGQLSREFNFMLNQNEEQSYQLAETRKYIDGITEEVPVLLGYVDRHLEYRFVNKTYERWFGISENEFIGKHIQVGLGEVLFNRISHYIDAVMSGELTSFECHLDDKKSY